MLSLSDCRRATLPIWGISLDDPLSTMPLGTYMAISRGFSSIKKRPGHRERPSRWVGNAKLLAVVQPIQRRKVMAESEERRLRSVASHGFFTSLRYAQNDLL